MGPPSTTVILCIVEPWLCWSSGVTRESEDQLPYSGYDGARQTDHYESQVGRLWFPDKRTSFQKVLYSLQTL